MKELMRDLHYVPPLILLALLLYFRRTRRWLSRAIFFVSLGLLGSTVRR